MTLLLDFWKGFKKGFQKFGHRIGGIVNTVLLSIVYIFGVGISAIMARMTGKRFLKMKKMKGSYWETLDLKKRPIDEHYRQF